MPRNKYPEETIKKILDVSFKLFTEKGYEQTTVLDIVANLGGLTRGAFYHHFKSKEDVMEALLEKMYQEANPFEKVMKHEGLSGLERIRLLIKYSVVDGFMDEKKAELDRMALPLLSNPRFLAEQIKGGHEAARFLTPIIEEGMADGSIPAGDAKILAELLMLFFNIWMIPTIYPCDEREAGEKIMLIKRIFDSLGIPLIDYDLMAGFENLAALEYPPKP